jgi:hypothetical protein
MKNIRKLYIKESTLGMEDSLDREIEAWSYPKAFSRAPLTTV